MKKSPFLFLALFASVASIAAQNAVPLPIATETIQQLRLAASQPAT